MKDIFSSQATVYRHFRPGYPEALFDHIFGHVKAFDAAWDCGTGNGQVAISLAEKFDSVYATDISLNQISFAIEKENIIYKIESAESSSFEDNTFDLVTAGQAAHWFDLDKFFAEVKRTGKPGGVLAIFGYGLLETKGEINKIILDFYKNIVGPFWDDERRHLDEGYENLPFPFEELPGIHTVNTVHWTLDHITGFLNSWSAVQHFIAAHHYNPIEDVYPRLTASWGEADKKEFSFPVFLKMGRIES